MEEVDSVINRLHESVNPFGFPQESKNNVKHLQWRRSLQKKDDGNTVSYHGYI
jgi:hypothetical protein